MEQFESEFNRARNIFFEVKQLKLTYEQLYSDAGNWQIISEASLEFFRLVHWSFRDSMIMQLCKLTDPKVQGRGKNSHLNLTLEYLLKSDVVEKSGKYQKIIDLYENKITHLRKPLKEFRHKLGAHADYPTMMSSSIVDPLEGEIFALFDAVEEFFILMNSSVFGYCSLKSSSSSNSYRKGASDLLKILNKQRE
ncbi:hypothetical protein Sden_0423 [Shewanella denitrificans OS217]|uniref:Uncharacterized protein n=1 Tax=Shewanella denitrificans (strain OS217 / ATCC BAA-1090 / DSM 15013) TaxID=318161 RepID=Q12S60_SHEDO|nr:hypothetical protein [Shewanella denitrificans]ABE53716.1 hypothetical protein Sden_0423 [Shewanella denitrificans OS217]